MPKTLQHDSEAVDRPIETNDSNHLDLLTFLYNEKEGSREVVNVHYELSQELAKAKTERIIGIIKEGLLKKGGEN